MDIGACESQDTGRGAKVWGHQEMQRPLAEHVSRAEWQEFPLPAYMGVCVLSVCRGKTG